MSPHAAWHSSRSSVLSFTLTLTLVALCACRKIRITQWKKDEVGLRFRAQCMQVDLR